MSSVPAGRILSSSTLASTDSTSAVTMPESTPFESLPPAWLTKQLTAQATSNDMTANAAATPLPNLEPVFFTDQPPISSMHIPQDGPLVSNHRITGLA